MPDHQSIPSARKNASDVADALSALGFQVTLGLDQSADEMRSRIKGFFSTARAALSSRAIAVLYFSGQGFQYRSVQGRSENYIVPADVPVMDDLSAMAKQSININHEVLLPASLPNDGSAVLIFFGVLRADSSKEKIARTGTFNQINPPPGTILAFSSAPGQFGVASASTNENSVYTLALLTELRKATPSISIKDLLDTVKFRVRRITKNSESGPQPQMQDPEVAAKLNLSLSFAPATSDVGASEVEEAAWTRIERTLGPEERKKLLIGFIDQFRDSRFLELARIRLERADLSEAATQRNRVTIETDIPDPQFQADQAKALDADKDAAYRVALAFRDGTQGVPRDERKMIQWLRHASELKNGIASYTLSVHYRNRGIDREAVRSENAAVAQGYTLPERIARARGGGGSVDTRPPELLEDFPWPPPEPSTQTVLPNSLFYETPLRLSLSEVGDRIVRALQHAHYYEYSYYGAPNGFALAARLERIDRDGTPWPEIFRFLQPGADGPFSLSMYIRQLFFAPEGLYRQVIFVVTDQPFRATGAALDPSGAIRLLMSGSNRLPNEYGQLEFSRDHRVSALIYEFRKGPKDKDVSTLRPSRLSARTHLDRAGIYQALSRMR